MRWIEGILFFLSALAVTAGGFLLFLAFVLVPSINDPATGEGPWGLVALAAICFAAAVALFFGGRWAQRH
jgi:hypothetical protein